MRMVIAVDGELLIGRVPGSGIAGQRQAMAEISAGLMPLLRGPHEIALTHGNAAQIGYMLLRAEIASHVVHNLPLDVCGSDTQGATGYLLQQVIRNCLAAEGGAPGREVVTLVTQVLVAPNDPGFSAPARGIGPYFDREKAEMYAAGRGWVFTLQPGNGYRRMVPGLTPRAIIEAGTIKRLLSRETLVICAGGGGVPVVQNGGGGLVGVEAVIDKASTAGLLAAEIGAEALVFVSPTDRLGQLLGLKAQGGPQPVTCEALTAEAFDGWEADLAHKLAAARQFLAGGGRRVLIAPIAEVAQVLTLPDGLYVAA